MKKDRKGVSLSKNIAKQSGFANKKINRHYKIFVNLPFNYF